ncbi:hypothetical protein RIF29_25051 [Crotalaria pallida]|uniref:Uncharacterized protein n=1 Tax=Crotalaria pallida TaxID=3830 RepID=A0AAN9ELP8_CROPI
MTPMSVLKLKSQGLSRPLTSRVIVTVQLPRLGMTRVRLLWNANITSSSGRDRLQTLEPSWIPSNRTEDTTFGPKAKHLTRNNTKLGTGPSNFLELGARVMNMTLDDYDRPNPTITHHSKARLISARSEVTTEYRHLNDSILT